MTYTDAELIAMVEKNVRSMTDAFLRESWNVAYDKSVSARGVSRQRFWDSVRDIYGAELDRRDIVRECTIDYCHALAYAVTPNGVRVCAGHADMRYDTAL